MKSVSSTGLLNNVITNDSTSIYVSLLLSPPHGASEQEMNQYVR